MKAQGPQQHQKNSVKFSVNLLKIKIKLTLTQEHVWFFPSVGTVLSAGSKPRFLNVSLEQVCTHRHESVAVLGTDRTETGIKMPGAKLSSRVFGGLPKAKF